MKFVLTELIKPISRRIGSALAGALLALGAADQLAQQVELVATALVLFAADLFLSYKERN